MDAPSALELSTANCSLPPIQGLDDPFCGNPGSAFVLVAPQAYLVVMPDNLITG
jgi:hypothetical protein